MCEGSFSWYFSTLSKNSEFATRVDEWRLRGKPKQHAIEWNLEQWAKTFPDQADFLNELSRRKLGMLDRELVHQTVFLEAEKGNYLNGFLAVMIWGYGGDARGPFRTNRILQQPNALDSIEKAFHFLQDLEIGEAYDCLVTNGPKYLGPAFATKHLYFASNSK